MKETALATLLPLIAQARAEGKWLYCAYQDLWFSPDELEADNRDGRFCWGASNWTLRSPHEYEAELLEKMIAAKFALNCFRRRAGFES